MSRARSRFVAFAAALPLFVVGPVLSASAEDGPVSQATMVQTLGDYRVGPSAGFRGDVARGVSGTTAVLKLDVAPSAVVNAVVVRVTMDRAFSIYQHFNSNDGFAVYKDTNGNGLLDVAEHAAGPVTNPGYSVTGDNGAAVVTLTTDAAKATGEDDYLITVHPTANPVADRAVTFTVPTGGLQTSAGNLPLAPFSTTDVVIDSLAPALIPATNFTPVNRKPTTFCPPGAAAGECGDDGYLVYRGATPAEDGAKIGFYNAPGDVSDAALLIAAPAGENTPAVPAVYDLTSVPAAEGDKVELDIGNGTGRDASVAGSKALNNQASDDVVVAQWDLMGNLASQTFTNNNCVVGSANCPTALTPRGNDVTGPKTTSFTVAMNNINANTGSTPSAHPVTGTIGGTDSAKPANRTETPVRMVANLHRLSDQDTSVFAGPQAWSAAVTPASSVTATSNVNASSDENYPSPSRVRATAVLVDVTGNPSISANSPVRYRDLVKPKIASLSLLDANANGQPNTGESYRVVFDDPVDTSKVTSSNVHTQLDPDNVAGSTSCGVTQETPLPDCPWWGDGATVSWPDTRTLLIKLGTPDANCPGNHLECRLAVAGDEVNASTNTTSGVLDLAGNVIDNTPFIIQNPYVQESSAKTIDAAALSAPAVFGTGRDGILEAIDVTFTGPITKASITEASDAGKFTVSVPGGSTLTASASGLGGGSTSTVVQLSFTPPAEEWALWGTAATPIVKLTDSTIVKSGTQAVLAFTIAAADGAAPVPVSIKTQDTGTANGQIDKILVKYSENVVALAENECGYTVTGYGDSAYIPPSAGPSQGTCPGTSAGPPTQHRTPFAAVAGQPDTVALTLKPLTTPDTHATPAVSFNAANQVPAYGPGNGPGNTDAPTCNQNASLVGASVPNCPVVDGSGNGLGSFSGTASDGAGPAILTRTTADNDADGHLDAINVTYSESLSTPSIGAAQFQVTEPAYTVFKVDQSGDMSIKITLVPSTGTGDTSVKPKLQSTAAAPADTSDSANPTPVDSAGVVTVDKAGPAIMGACISTTVPADTPAAEKTARLGNCPEGAGDKIAVLFSEALDTTAGVVAISDFVVEQPAGTPKTVGTASAPANTSDGRSSIVTLTMAANNNLDNTKDAFVKLATAGAVNDNATPTKNPSVQTAMIVAWGPPVVTLDVTCPVAATVGHCSADYVNTGAAGSPGVIGWRLADQAVAPPLPAAGDFSATQPTRYPAEGKITEGTHTFWLRGRDAFNRVSAEVTQSVTVYKAPEIRDVQMVNSTPRRTGTWSRTSTVLDGDAILIGADAYGTDAAQWAANDAPVGGGCLAHHMSIDVRSLSGRSTDGAVRPSRCDLKTGTESPYRQMQFPVIRAGGTTKYPVGTVLKVTDTDPGSMIVDGPGGTLRRRQFISVSARRSWMITDASVIKVPSTLVSAIPRTTNLGYRNGALLRSSTGYYYVYEGLKRPVSATQLSAWRMSTSTAYRPTSAELKAIPTGSRITGTAHAAGTWIKYSDGRIYQIVRNKQGVAVRRKLASTSALRTLVPTSHIYPANSTDSKLAIDTWLRGYRDGTLLLFGDDTLGVISRGSLRKFANPATFNTLGYATANALKPNGAAMPRVSGEAYLVGTPIDRYKFSTVVIKVTNKAGGLDTEVVLPSLGGLYGVGTIDPVPMGWDTTR